VTKTWLRPISPELYGRDRYMRIQEQSGPASTQQSGGLPVWKLLALTMAGFLAIMTETMPAGLLPQIGQGLGVSEALAGQLVTLYALGSVLAAIPVIAATRSWNRRQLFLLAIVGILVFNSITAMSSHYGLTLVARFIAGMAAGVVWGLLAGYARRLAPPHLQGRALALAGLGQPIALAIGVPLGTLLGTLFDWRVAGRLGAAGGARLFRPICGAKAVNPAGRFAAGYRRCSAGVVRLDTGAQHPLYLHRAFSDLCRAWEARRCSAAAIRPCVHHRHLDRGPGS
jgi:MFS family permease